MELQLVEARQVELQRAEVRQVEVRQVEVRQVEVRQVEVRQVEVRQVAVLLVAVLLVAAREEAPLEAQLAEGRQVPPSLNGARPLAFFAASASTPHRTSPVGWATRRASPWAP